MPVLFGALAGSGVLPLSREACERAIRGAGRGAEASLRGFAPATTSPPRAPGPSAEPAPPRRASSLDEVMHLGMRGCKDYQGEGYAELFTQRMKSLVGGDAKVATTVARHLALWMAYEDIIRVADLKTRASRFERVRREVGAKDGEPVVVIDYLKPGNRGIRVRLSLASSEKTCFVAQRRGKLDAYNVGMHIKTSGLFGLPGGALARVDESRGGRAASAMARSST